MYACLYCPGNGALLMECAAEFSPHVEQTAADTVIFDVQGLASLYGPPEQLARAIECRAGVPANIAIAANPEAALHAARGIRGVTVIAPGKEAETLAPLPVNLLGGSAECAELLDLWGIRTFGEFAKLPPLGVAARLGDEGVRLQRLARGEGYRQLRPAEAALRFEAEMELDHPVELLEPLSFVISRLLNEVCDQLRGRSLATNELRLSLLLENAPEHSATLRLPIPMLDARAFLKMLQLELSGRPPVAAVLKAHLAAEPVKPRRTQHGLFLPSSPEPEKLELTIARVKHLVGAGNVGTPELNDTHRPDSFSMQAFAPSPNAEMREAGEPSESTRLCLRRFRPPRYAQVLMVNNRPVRVISPSVSGRVVMAKGPWRTSGDWWRNDAWNRDEWDIALEGGGVFRMYREIDSERWFIEAIYD
jgi:protein ImuB